LCKQSINHEKNNDKNNGVDGLGGNLFNAFSGTGHGWFMKVIFPRGSFLMTEAMAMSRPAS
jgi:hypothetical protein